MAEQTTELKPNRELELTEDFILFCPTYEAGVEFVDDFLDDHAQLCRGIVGLGNRNFGSDFCHLAKRYAKTYQLPLLYTLEFSGTPQDVQTVKGIIAHES